MNHDQLFKEVIQAFFGEFLELFFPNEAASLNLDSVTFLNQEVFTDIPDGDVRRVDVLAEVRTRDGETEIIYVHIEIQANREATMPFRMWEYYSLLRLRRKAKVFPIVLYLTPGAGGLTVERYSEGVLGRNVLSFEYPVVGLPDMAAEQFEQGRALGIALSALMRSVESNRAERKYRVLSSVVTAPIDEARRMLLTAIVNNYLLLNQEEEQIFAQRVQRDAGIGADQGMAVLTMERVYELIRDIERARALEEGLQQGRQLGLEEGRQQGIHLGLEEGRQQGIHLGLEEGRQEGRQEGLLEGLRTTLLRQLRRKFGTLPPTVEETINAIQSTESLEALTDRILTAASLADMGLPST